MIRLDNVSKQNGHQILFIEASMALFRGEKVGLVGPNGAGKTTLLNLAVGLLAPDTGTIEVLGGVPGTGQAQLSRVGFLAKDAPVYTGLSVADHLKLGARLNPGWDAALAQSRVVPRSELAGGDVLPRPFVVKPIDEGSSVGVPIVRGE